MQASVKARQSRLILGSESRWRKEILQQAGFKFIQMAPKINEKSIRLNDPEALTIALAEAKADAIDQRLHKNFKREGTFLITSDQVVSVKGLILEKPKNSSEIKGFLYKYNQTNPATFTAVHVRNLGTGKSKTVCDKAVLCFDIFEKDDIELASKQGLCRLCAGAIVLESEPFASKLLFIEGTLESVKGLPLHVLFALLIALGYDGNLPIV